MLKEIREDRSMQETQSFIYK